MAKRPGLNSGRMQHVIRFEEPYTSSAGRANEPMTSWRKWRDAYAEIRNTPGREFYQQGPNYPSTTGQTRTDQIFKFTCRYFDVLGVQHTMRIKFEGKYYNITDIQPDHRNLSETVIEARLTQ